MINRNLITIVVGKIMQMIILFASIRFLTHFLSEKEVGNYYLILAIVTFYNLVLLNPPGMYFSRHILEWKHSKNLYNAILPFSIYIFLVAVISLPLNLIFIKISNLNTIFTFPLLLILFLIITVSTLHRNMINAINNMGNRGTFVSLFLLSQLLGLIFSIAIIHMTTKKSSLFWILGVVIGEILLLPFVIKFYGRNNRISYSKIKEKINKGTIKDILNYSLPICITTLFIWGQSMGYRFYVNNLFSVEVLAYIAIGFSISSSIFNAIEILATQYFGSQKE